MSFFWPSWVELSRAECCLMTSALSEGFWCCGKTWNLNLKLECHSCWLLELNVNVNVYVYSLISPWVQQTSQFTPLVLELSLLYSLISSGENSAHFLQLMPFTILQFSFHQVSITAGWAEAVRNEKFARHSYTTSSGNWTRDLLSLSPNTLINWATWSNQP